MEGKKCSRMRTNLSNKGLISADRSNKATLLLTIPRSGFKSSAKDLPAPISQIVNRRLLESRFRARGSLPVMILDAQEAHLSVIV